MIIVVDKLKYDIVTKKFSTLLTGYYHQYKFKFLKKLKLIIMSLYGLMIKTKQKQNSYGQTKI